MSQGKIHEMGSVVLGSITAVGIGSFLLQALGTLLLGIIGALGGYLFHKIIKPRLDKAINKEKK